MNGVTIIETIYHYKTLISSYWPFIFWLTGMIVCLVGVILPDDSPLHKPLIIITILCLVAALTSMILSHINNKNNIEKISYKVKVNNNVTFGEFNKHYKIESAEGDNIYIVEERTFDNKDIYKKKE